MGDKALNHAHRARTNVRRILMSAPTQSSVWTFALELGRTLGERGIDVVLAAVGARLSAESARDAHAIPSLTLVEHTHRPFGVHDDDDDTWLHLLEKLHAPDVVHLNHTPRDSQSFLCPLVITAHADWPALDSASRRTLQNASAVAASSRALLGEMQRAYGPLRKSRVVPYGCEGSQFVQEEKGELVFCAAQLWDKNKNLSLIAKVAANLSWPTYVAGGVAPPSIAARTSVRDLLDVHYLGDLSRKEIAHWLARAPIFVWPALQADFGFRALEAALNGCALVLGDIPSLREVWNGAAVFVDPHDARALELVLQRLISDDGERISLALAAKHKAQTYTAARMGDGYVALYEEAFAASPALPSDTTRLSL